METGKPGLPNAIVHSNSVAAQTEKRMDIQAPLTAVYIHTGPTFPVQPYTQPPAATRSPATLHLAMPPLYSKETLPFLTFHIAGGLQAQPGLSLPAAAPVVRPKSAGKHVCPHCGRDCMKPSVLEKHLRCHTGERPYPCTTCGVSFKTQSNLYKHKRTQAHARLSSESEQSSSLDSMSSSRETCTPSASLDESTSMDKEATLFAAEITCSAGTAVVSSVQMQGSVSTPNELTHAGHRTEPNESNTVTTEEENQRIDKEKPPLTISRHLPLQRQEATLFSKLWENSVSRGKSQNHESTDSGFSESSDHYPSPGSVLPEHSMDSLTESTKEHLEETSNTQILSKSGQGGQELNSTSKKKEQKTLEERISKLISENSAVVEDKQLENVRPRKTVLSKQGSIDLPMPYTYKDSFHFDMRIGKTPNVGLQGNRNHGIYSSVPSQCSNTMDHTPLTRSSSLPFSVTLLQPEKSSQTSSFQSDYETLIRRGSSGQINPTGFAIKPVNQQSSTHRPLVRQTAVDCNHATDGLFMNSSVEEAYPGSVSCDADGGDICGEPSGRKFRRKKSQKFAYNKWYMYGGGTFKKLYNSDKGGDESRKCLPHPEQEVIQGLQKRSSAVNKETVKTTASLLNFTSATVCHPGCPPAKVSLVSALDVNQTINKLPTSCSSLKTPLHRNVSLSVQPLPPIGSLVSHKIDSINKAEAGRLINVEKHPDSSLQLCETQIPSDRKKQKTDDKIICPLEMETDPNMLTHPPPSVTGSVPQQDTNRTYISLQQTQKHTQLKGVLFKACIINANTPSVSASPVTSTQSPAKTSFLPKYQLKLPNSAEPDSDPAPNVVDKPTGTDGHNFTSALPFYHTEHSTPLVTTFEKKSIDPVASPLMQSCGIKKVPSFSPTQGQLRLPCFATNFCQGETLRLNKCITPSVAVAHRQFADTTKTTTCLQDNQAGLCSTSIQPTKPARATASMQLTRPAPTTNYPVTHTVTTATNQISPTAITALSEHQPLPIPALSHTQLSPTSDQSSPLNRAFSSSNTPIVPCHIVPLDQMQSASQNVFHVHTADLQICLQIISDEQLALIEPQIERQAESALSHRHDSEAMSLEETQEKTHSSVHGRSRHDESDRSGFGKESNQSKCLPTLDMDKMQPQLSEQYGKMEPKLKLNEQSNSSQPEVSAESKPPKALDSLQHPHKYALLNMVTETKRSTGDGLTSASHDGVKSERSQTLEKDDAPSRNRCTEEQLLQDIKVSRSGPMKAKGEAYKSSRIESGDSLHSIQVGLSQASSAARADELSGSVSTFSINKCKTPGQLNSQASIHCSNLVKLTSTDAENSAKHEGMGCERVGLTEDSASSQKKSRSVSQDGISSADSKKLLDQPTLVSSCVKMETLKDNTAVSTSIQSLTAELMEGSTQDRSAAPVEPQIQGLGETSDCTDRRPRQTHEPEETNHQRVEEQAGGEVQGEDKNGEIKRDEQPEEKGEAKTDCRYTSLEDLTKPEGYNRKLMAVADSFKNSWLPESHLQDLSQTHSGMSDHRPQRASSLSNNLNAPASCDQTRLLVSSQPQSETNNLYFSQQHSESSVIHNQQRLNFCESISSHLIKAHVQSTETQSAFSHLESSPQQTQSFSHQEQKQATITLSVQQGNTTSSNNNTEVSCCTKVTLESHTSLLPSVKTFSSSAPHSQEPFYTQVSEATSELTADNQLLNNTVLDDGTVQPLKYIEHEDYQDSKDNMPNDFMSQSSNSERSDNTNKYQSFFLAGQLQGYPSAECLTGGVRPVQSCQDYTEDTSSSDDEGKLIIEL